MKIISIKAITLQLFLLFPLLLQAQLATPEVFSDHMVLQRGTNIPIWGTSRPSDFIEVSINKISTKVSAGEDGKWKAYLGALEAGGPYTLSIQSSSNPADSLLFSDVMKGDVWFASGQSNMEFQVQETDNSKEAIAQAHNNNIRFLKVPHEISLEPKDDILPTSWKVSDSASVKELSAVAYYFAQKLEGDLNIPIGIIQSTWGGTPVEAWTSREMLLSSSLTRQMVIENDSVDFRDLKQDSLHLDRFWDIVYNPKNRLDSIVPKLGFNDKDWKTVQVPGDISQWENEPYEGIIWLRKKNRNQQDKFCRSGDPPGASRNELLALF